MAIYLCLLMAILSPYLYARITTDRLAKYSNRVPSITVVPQTDPLTKWEMNI